MKKLLIYSLSILAFLWSCEPMEDIYDELEQSKEPYNENIEYTLSETDYNTASKAALKDAKDQTDSTYANYIGSDMAFNEYFLAADYVGPVLSTNFPALNKKSSAVVTYNVNEGKPAYLNDYAQAEEYELTAADYANVDDKIAELGYFIPSLPSEEFLTGILSSNVTASEDELRLVIYNESEYEPSGAVAKKIFFDDFNDSTLNQWITHSVTGDQVWEISEQYGIDDSPCGKMSGFDGQSFENEDWLIIPPMNLTGYTDLEFSFFSATNYDGLDIEVKYSTDYAGSGDPTTATWTDFTGYTLSPGEWAWTESGKLALTNSASLSIAFVFYSTDIESKTWEIDDVTVKGKSSKKSANADLFDTYNKFYRFDGTSWKAEEGVIALSAPDYNSMGAPGKYDNFSSDVKPSDYIPTFLDQTKAYAIEGETFAVAYKYYNGTTTSTTADEFTFNSGQWTMFDGIVEESNQFIHTGEEWVFDPTIRFDMVNSDYQLIVEWVKVNLSPDYLDSYGTAEFYHGASAYYANYDLRLSKRTEFGIPGFDGLSQEDGVDLTWERLAESIQLMLSLKYPDAVTDVSGIDVHYFVTFDTYENNLSKNNYTIEFQCTKSGPNPEFTQVGEIVINN